jgi:hypothetical protein
MIYGGLTIVLSLRLSDLHPRASILLVVSSFFSIAILTVYFLVTGPTRNWYGTKASLKVFGIGFVGAIVLTMASLWLNTHHGPAGSTTIVVPAWLMSRHTFYGGCVLGVLVQVYSLVAAVRLYFGQVEKKNRIALLVLLWIGLLISSLVVWSYGASIARASWFV